MDQGGERQGPSPLHFSLRRNQGIFQEREATKVFQASAFAGETLRHELGRSWKGGGKTDEKEHLKNSSVREVRARPFSSLAHPRNYDL